MGEGSVLKVILLGQGAPGLRGMSLLSAPVPQPLSRAEILDSQDRHKSLLGAVCCFYLVWGLSSCPAQRSINLPTFFWDCLSFSTESPESQEASQSCANQMSVYTIHV